MEGKVGRETSRYTEGKEGQSEIWKEVAQTNEGQEARKKTEGKECHAVEALKESGLGPKERLSESPYRKSCVGAMFI